MNNCTTSLCRIISTVFIISLMLIYGCPAPPNPANLYTLTTQVTGQGTVYPSGGSYVSGSIVQLRAIPSAGWSFDHWAGDITGTNNPKTITMNANITAVAVFVSSSVNRAPEAYDLMVSTERNNSVNITLQADDRDNDPLSYQIVSAPTHGILSGSLPNVIYNPTFGYVGPDKFTYKANDGQADSNTATVNIVVTEPASTGWARTFGAINTDIIHDVAVGPNGNIYIVGEFQDVVDFDPSVNTALYRSAGQRDAFLAKYSVDGTFQWVRTIGGQNDDIGYSVSVDGNGNVYIVGSFHATITVDNPSGTIEQSNGGADIFLAKFTPAGTLVWSHSIGGPGDDEAFASAVDAFGNLYIGGYFEQSVDFDPTSGMDSKTSAGQRDAFLSKIITSTGDYGWTVIFGGPGADDAITGVAGDANGNIYAAGYFGNYIALNPNGSSTKVNTKGQSDAFVVKLNSNHGYLWGYTIGGAGEDRAMSVASTGVGNIVLGGYFEQTVNLDPTGGSSMANSAGGTDGFVIALNATGNFQWAHQIGGIGDDLIMDVALEDTSGNVYVVGGFQGTVDFDFSGGLDQYTSFGNSFDAFITKMTATGNYLFTRTFGSNGTDIFNGVSSAPTTLLTYAGGFFQQTVDFDPSASEQKHTAFGAEDCCLIKLTSAGGW